MGETASDFWCGAADFRWCSHQGQVWVTKDQRQGQTRMSTPPFSRGRLHSGDVDLDVFAIDLAVFGGAEVVAFARVEVVVLTMEGAAGVGREHRVAPDALGLGMEVAVECGLGVVLGE